MPFACSVVIPAYNAAAVLSQQLSALADQVDAPQFEVIVADNGSSDDLAGVVSLWSPKLDVRIVDASARRGPSAARNVGATSSTAPLLLFCDADDIVAPRWVAELVAALGAHTFVGGPCRPFSTRPGIWLPQYADDALPVAWDSWTYAFAGNFGIRADVWSALGGFDERLTGAEEIEFAWRADRAGHQPVFVPAASLAYRVRPGLRGRLWHEYNSGRGTAMLADRLVPHLVTRRSWKSQTRHVAILVMRFPRSLRGARWAAWAAILAYEMGTTAGRRVNDAPES